VLTLPDVAIGAILAAVIAGLISLVGLVVSKEQKTSEFRQAWIDALRNEISALISHANAIHGAYFVHSAPTADAWKDMRMDFVGINEAAAKIRLRLNPGEEPSRAILHTIETLEEIMAPGKKINHHELNILEKRLKKEWIRVKKGEITYRIAKIMAIVIVLTFVGALLVTILHELVPIPLFRDKDAVPSALTSGYEQTSRCLSEGYSYNSGSLQERALESARQSGRGADGGDIGTTARINQSSIEAVRYGCAARATLSTTRAVSCCSLRHSPAAVQSCT
jgi:hypothetical protein